MVQGSSNSAHSKEALFRYRVVSEVLTRIARGQPRAHAVREVTERSCLEVDGRERKVSPRTAYRWLSKFERGGLEALVPARRARTATSVVLEEQLITFVRAEKDRDPRASVPELLERAREKGVLQSEQTVDRTTVWRALRRMGLPTRHRPNKREGDTRRFAYPNRMEMVLCDGKHFRAGASRLRRVALNFLDDSTRMALHVRVGTAESTELFLRGLYAVIQRYGLMDAIFVDHGPGFISDDTARVAAQLEIMLIHGTKAYPEGHGKIEKFNQTTIAGILRSLDGAHDVDPGLRGLESRLNHHYGRYNDRPHEGLSGAKPSERWHGDIRELRFPSDEEALRSKFVLTDERDVSNDHIIRHSGKLYEAPRGLAGQKRLIVYRQVLSGELSIFHKGRYMTIHEVDLARNATDRRGQRAPLVEETAPVKTAATLAYERDHATMVDSDGGYQD